MCHYVLIFSLPNWIGIIVYVLLHNAELRKIQDNARQHFQKIFKDHEKNKLLLETQKRELELRGQELEKRETQNEYERKKLAEDIEEVCQMLLCSSLFYILIKLFFFFEG